jgi:DHA1 family tetracycline resistance protein-like MFS transporter
MLHMTWVLYTKFKFGWGPSQVGWSLFAVGVVSALSQGVLLKPLLARFSPQRLASVGMCVGALSYLLFGLATQGWMMYLVICLGLLGGTAQAAMQSIISNAADGREQGQTMGAVSSLSSLMAVVAPIIGLELLRWVSHRPAGDWLMGLPFFTCAALQLAAAVIAIRTFRKRAARATKAPGADSPAPHA